jgi:hypothetical protein
MSPLYGFFTSGVHWMGCHVYGRPTNWLLSNYTEIPYASGHDN